MQSDRARQWYPPLVSAHMSTGCPWAQTLTCIHHPCFFPSLLPSFTAEFLLGTRALREGRTQSRTGVSVHVLQGKTEKVKFWARYVVLKFLCTNTIVPSGSWEWVWRPTLRLGQGRIRLVSEWVPKYRGVGRGALVLYRRLRHGSIWWSTPQPHPQQSLMKEKVLACPNCFIHTRWECICLT